MDAITELSLPGEETTFLSVNNFLSTMRISEKALYIFAASVAGSACTAFLPSRVALSSVSLQSAFSRGIGNEKLLSYATTAVTRSRSRSTTLQMNVFSSLFGGGAQQSSINYTTLEFPGNELGQMALEGKVVVNSERFPNLKAATFAGGCFWGLELAYQRVPGVVYTAVGYTQGPELTPKYGQVCSGATGHTEAVLVYYDPKECSYENVSFTLPCLNFLLLVCSLLILFFNSMYRIISVLFCDLSKTYVRPIPTH